eukprot:scaffold4223_cov189-Amphora_coffeaeformis.AAC.60
MTTTLPDDDDDNHIPHRPYGDGIRLAATSAMVGLGCSSFSGFFFDKNVKNVSTTTTATRPPEWLTNTKTTDVATVDPSHDLVRGWIATIHYAIREAGITLLDTAPWYGHGLSEQVVGLALQELFANKDNTTKRSHITINTKVGRYEADPSAQFDFSRAATLASVERSLQRLQTTYIDVLQLHDPEFCPSLDILLQETIPALIECRESDKCRALGLTGYPLAVQRQIFQATLEMFPHAPQIWDQALTYGHYNLHDMTLIRQPHGLERTSIDGTDDDDDESSYFDYCRAQNCICLAAAPLSMGLLTPTASPPDWHPASAALLRACQQAAQICATHKVNLAELAMLVALSEPKLPVTILGMKDVDQVQTVQRLCRRLQVAKFDLAEALTQEERVVWKQLQDTEQGPFAQVWKTGNYHWGGVSQVCEFWQSVPGNPTIKKWQASSA